MDTFNPGDMVRRIGHDYYNAKVGNVYRVSECAGRAMLLEGDPVAYDPGYFELAKGYEVPVKAIVTNAPAGRKDDSGKLDMSLLDDMPRAISAVVEVMQWAVTKKQPVPYERGSWLGVEAVRYRAAMQRHQVAAAQQASQKVGFADPSRQALVERDAETNLLHLAHQACSALMALENTLREMEKKGGHNA